MTKDNSNYELKVALFIVFLICVGFVTLTWVSKLELDSYKHTCDDKIYLQKKQINELTSIITQLQSELYITQTRLAMYTMDAKAERLGLNVDYLEIPDSSLVMRVEYNGSVWENISVGDTSGVDITP